MLLYGINYSSATFWEEYWYVSMESMTLSLLSSHISFQPSADNTWGATMVVKFVQQCGRFKKGKLGLIWYSFSPISSLMAWLAVFIYISSILVAEREFPCGVIPLSGNTFEAQRHPDHRQHLSLSAASLPASFFTPWIKLYLDSN